MRCPKSMAGVAVAALLSLSPGALAQDHLKLAVGARGVGETFVPELGQNAGIFKKHGLALDIFYTQGGGETIQVVISNAAHIGVAIGFLGTIGAFAKGAPVRVIGSTFTGGNQLFWYVRADSADQVAEGCRRQDRGLFDQRLLDPHLGAGAEEIHRRRFRADPDRRRARHLHPGDERPDRRRLGRRAVRRRCGRAGQDPRRRQGVGRSGAGPPDHPAPDRQFQRDGAAPRRVRALHARLSRGAGLGLFDAGGARGLRAMGQHLGGDRQARARRIPAQGRPSIPTGFPASTTSWRTR